MSKKIIGVLIVVVIALGIYFSNKFETPKEVVIGVSAPLTGNLAFLGESYKKGIELAMKEVNSQNTKYTYKVVFEDDGFDPAKGVTAATKLLQIDRADVLLSFGSPVGNAIGPVAEKNKVIHINSIASDPNVAKGEYNFVHWTPPYKETELFSAELKRRGIKQVVLLEQNQPGVLAVTKSLREELTKTEIEITASELFNGDTKDFRSIISKIKNAKADMYILEATSPSLEVLARQLRELGISGNFTSIETFEFTDDPKLFEGSWYVNAADQSPEFISKYKSLYGENPKLGAGNGYDSIKMLVETIENNGPKNIRDSFAKIKNYVGAMGDDLRVDSEGIIVSDAVVRVIENGVPKTIN